MDRIQQLDALVAQFDLNTHPFYQAWRMGELPTEKLIDYAGEYGRFVATIAEGWEALGETHYAHEERDHEVLWDDFKAAIGSEKLSNRPETEVLVTAARELFRERATAAGALFAFEAQQPNTSQSKLAGLNEHYTVSDKGKEYFRVHAGDFAEVEDLKKTIAAMSDEEFARTRAACAVVCAAMWTALDGVYYGRTLVSA